MNKHSERVVNDFRDHGRGTKFLCEVLMFTLFQRSCDSREVCGAIEIGEGNWVEWLLACPEKGWLGEPDRSERTSLQPPSHFSE